LEKAVSSVRIGICVFVLLAGCASASQSKAGGGTTPLEPASDAVRRLEQQSAEQASRIEELEARLGLLEQESRGFREGGPGKPVETVRIGGRRSRAEDEDDTEPPRTTAVLRLHEEEPEEAEPLRRPEPPAGVAQRLGVVPLPEERAQANAKIAAPASDEPREQYRAALRTLQQRRWEQARSALASLVASFPGHELADDALYWKGEAFYAERRYAEALAEFQAVLDRFPSSNKGADALLKAGMCKKRQGAVSEAARYFQRLRNQYPDSEAARIASREGSS
jgi:tol-pal system protein YbgF